MMLPWTKVGHFDPVAVLHLTRISFCFFFKDQFYHVNFLANVSLGLLWSLPEHLMVVFLK